MKIFSVFILHDKMIIFTVCADNEQSTYYYKKLKKKSKLKNKLCNPNARQFSIRTKKT